MSKIKSPREKKLLRLIHDRRNVYSENDKASRKNVPLSKQMGQQDLRQSSNSQLRTVLSLPEDEVVAVEQTVRDTIKSKSRRRFRKQADASLGFVLEHKRTGKWKGLVQPWSKP